MEGRQFDGVSRLVASAGSRRAAIKAAFALLAGGGALAVGAASARPALCRPAGRYCTTNRQCCNNKCRTGKRVPIASRNICDCDAPFAMCGKSCRDLSSDPNHCGGCGIKIDRETEICCDGVPTAIDEDNCHACGEVCGPDDICCGPEIGCAATCEQDSGACVPPDTCTPSIGNSNFWCGIRFETCEQIDGPCGAFADATGNAVTTPTAPCQVDADCVALFSTSVAVCVHGANRNQGYVPGLVGSGTCAIYSVSSQYC